MKGNPFSVDRAINLFRAANLPVSFCTFFLLVGGCMFVIAMTLSGLASIPLAETTQPSSFPFWMSKIHFSGLSLHRFS